MAQRVRALTSLGKDLSCVLRINVANHNLLQL